MRALVLLAAAWPLFAQGPPKSINPLVKKIVNEVQQERIETILKKLEAFGTRGNFSETDHPTRGVGAARRWIFEQMKTYSPRLEVRMDTYRVKKQTRIFRDVEIVNVVAVLPGKSYPDHQILISGHYDSLNLLRRRNTDGAAGDGQAPSEPSIEEQEKRAMAPAPGVSDDASGVAATMELARILSKYEFDKTLVFVAFAGEEIGLVGSSLHAQKAKDQKLAIEAVLNSDIIGTEVSGDGRRINRAVRVFSDDPNDSP
jgi:acetylornithine deacetylase/succinyl-diaminopimelate desuccinylase-like protein